jgi:hypothetical protein
MGRCKDTDTRMQCVRATKCILIGGGGGSTNVHIRTAWPIGRNSSECVYPGLWNVDRKGQTQPNNFRGKYMDQCFCVKDKNFTHKESLTRRETRII